MPRGQMSDEQKRAMQEARKKTKQERNEAFDVISRNSQFTNPKFWKKVDDETLDNVTKALEQAKEEQKKRRIRKLEDELSRLKSD